MNYTQTKDLCVSRIKIKKMLMLIESGDYLQNGLNFYRVYNVGKDIVTNQILYNPIKKELQMSHIYKIVEWHEIGNKYIWYSGNNPDLKNKLKMITRKYKLEKLNT